MTTTSTILAATIEIYETLRELYPNVQNSEEYFADLALSIAKAEANGIITDLFTLQAFSQVDEELTVTSGQLAEIPVI